MHVATLSDINSSGVDQLSPILKTSLNFINMRLALVFALLSAAVSAAPHDGAADAWMKRATSLDVYTCLCTATATSTSTTVTSTSTVVVTVEVTTTATSTPTTATATATPKIVLPASGAKFDYQLGGAYTPPTGVTVVARDRTASPANLGYDICYINGFQTQPGEKSIWPTAALLTTTSGSLVTDPDWKDEYILDTRTATSRAAIFSVVQPWIAACAASGYDAIEIDNLDSHTRFSSLTKAGNYALAALYIAEAHARGLAIGQKNDAENTALGKSTGFDFAVAEECGAYSECSLYTRVYSIVLGIEYSSDISATKFATFCTKTGHPTSLIYRDVDLVTSGKSAYVYSSCN
jgi:hypothetical protein